MPLCPQITNTPITVSLTADFTVTNVLPVLAANTEQLATTNATAAAAAAAAATAQSTATSALANAAVAYNAAVASLQPSANTIVNASNQMTAINGTGITVFSGASATSGARVVLNSVGLAGFNSGGSATFSISASTGAAVFSGSITGSAITGSTLNISGNCIIDASGFLTATGATITGAITATSGSFTGSIFSTSGTIGGFTLSSTSLTGSGGFTLSSTGQIDGGSANTIFYGKGNFGGGTAGSESLIVTGASNFNGTLTGTATSFVGQMNYSGVATGAGTAMVLVTTGSRVAIVTSSERFKEQIQYINTTGWLDKVMAMKPITYKTSQDFTTPGEPNETQIGFLAEDIYDIGGDLEKAVVLDPLGEPFSLSYDRLTVFLTLAIKELKAEIDQLKGA